MVVWFVEKKVLMLMANFCRCPQVLRLELAFHGPLVKIRYVGEDSTLLSDVLLSSDLKCAFLSDSSRVWAFV